jgi:tetratricopeptide (TPR) repeat protein
MDELAARLPQMPPNDLGRVLYALSLLALVVPASRALRPPSQITSLPRADESLVTRPLARPDGAALAPADFEAVRNRVLQAYLSYRRKDAVELLAVGDTAGGSEIEEAWLRFAEAYAPWSLGSQAPPDLLEKARLLFLAGTEAYGELRDPERRGQLLQRRRQQREQRANQPRGDRIQTDLLDPEAQFQKGMQLVAAGQDKKALELLEYAADLDAQNALYRAEAAWCRCRVTGQTERPLEALEEAVRIDPRSGLAWYYRGLVQGHAGRIGEAEESLRRAIKLMSPDRRPIDALKELTSRKR